MRRLSYEKRETGETGKSEERGLGCLEEGERVDVVRPMRSRRMSICVGGQQRSPMARPRRRSVCVGVEGGLGLLQERNSGGESPGGMRRKKDRFESVSLRDQLKQREEDHKRMVNEVRNMTFETKSLRRKCDNFQKEVQVSAETIQSLTEYKERVEEELKQMKEKFEEKESEFEAFKAESKEKMLLTDEQANRVIKRHIIEAEKRIQESKDEIEAKSQELRNEHARNTRAKLRRVIWRALEKKRQKDFRAGVRSDYRRMAELEDKLCKAKMELFRFQEWKLEQEKLSRQDLLQRLSLRDRLRKTLVKEQRYTKDAHSLELLLRMLSIKQYVRSFRRRKMMRKLCRFLVRATRRHLDDSLHGVPLSEYLATSRVVTGVQEMTSMIEMFERNIPTDNIDTLIANSENIVKGFWPLLGAIRAGAERWKSLSENFMAESLAAKSDRESPWGDESTDWEAPWSPTPGHAHRRLSVVSPSMRSRRLSVASPSVRVRRLSMADVALRSPRGSFTAEDSTLLPFPTTPPAPPARLTICASPSPSPRKRTKLSNRSKKGRTKRAATKGKLAALEARVKTLQKEVQRLERLNKNLTSNPQNARTTLFPRGREHYHSTESCGARSKGDKGKLPLDPLAMLYKYVYPELGHISDATEQGEQKKPAKRRPNTAHHRIRVPLSPSIQVTRPQFNKKNPYLAQSQKTPRPPHNRQRDRLRGRENKSDRHSERQQREPQVEVMECEMETAENRERRDVERKDCLEQDKSGAGRPV